MTDSRRTRVAVVADGQPGAAAIVAALDPGLFEAVPVEIARAGVAAVARADVVLPGGRVEVVGLLEMAGIPYAGSGMLASAVAADRAFTRRLASAAGLPVAGARAADGRRVICGVLADEPAVACPEGVPDAVPHLIRAVRAAFDLAGPATVTVLVTAAGEVVLDEIDAMPDLAPGAAFPEVWAAAGLGYPALVARVVRAGLRHGPGLH
ncbi:MULTISPECIES: D-alanine--D-alanine ligase family protein [Catenuloplanes]|uniref:D-alanine-D-alanine ligase-like ATP-grasp enzyme n=1 Tax=Catenuloplanes niger TaxID=587534 RepID=A0AAE3ZS01_9ACTN|nr:hypothetical protein [Catenuloplanes niger]MDR7324847.1 D-alanine-D-alanine ligase-like ATP-grasp enzyme [Catenuloplanes niger]